MFSGQTEEVEDSCSSINGSQTPVCKASTNTRSLFKEDYKAEKKLSSNGNALECRLHAPSDNFDQKIEKSSQGMESEDAMKSNGNQPSSRSSIGSDESLVNSK